MRNDRCHRVRDGRAEVDPRESVRAKSLDVIAYPRHECSGHKVWVRRASRAAAPPESWDGGSGQLVRTLGV
jgi:hypothetical protein